MPAGPREEGDWKEIEATSKSSSLTIDMAGVGGRGVWEGGCEGGIYSTVNVKGDRHFPQKRDLPKVRLGFLIVENVASPRTQTVAGKGQTGCSQ